MNNFIVGQVTPTMMQNLGFGTFVFFGAFSFVGGLFILFLVPETKGKTLEELNGEEEAEDGFTREKDIPSSSNSLTKRRGGVEGDV